MIRAPSSRILHGSYSYLYAQCQHVVKQPPARKFPPTSKRVWWTFGSPHREKAGSLEERFGPCRNRPSRSGP